MQNNTLTKQEIEEAKEKFEEILRDELAFFTYEEVKDQIVPKALDWLSSKKESWIAEAKEEFADYLLSLKDCEISSSLCSRHKTHFIGEYLAIWKAQKNTQREDK